MTDEMEDSEVKTVYPVESVIKDLKEELKYFLTEKGTVDITDYSLTTN